MRSQYSPCQHPEQKYRYLQTPGLLIDHELAMETHRLFKVPPSDGRTSSPEILTSLAPLKKMSMCHLPFLESKPPFSARGENGLWWRR